MVFRFSQGTHKSIFRGGKKMKRQFSPGAKAKREVKRLNDHITKLVIHTSDVVNKLDRKHSKEKTSLEKDVTYYKALSDLWHDRCKEESVENRTIRKHNKELQKLNTQLHTRNNHLETEIVQVEDSAYQNHLTLHNLLNTATSEKVDLEKGYEVIKQQRDSLIALLIASLVCSIILFIW